jgi:hypothetical protein
LALACRPTPRKLLQLRVALGKTNLTLPARALCSSHGGMCSELAFLYGVQMRCSRSQVDQKIRVKPKVLHILITWSWQIRPKSIVNCSSEYGIRSNVAAYSVRSIEGVENRPRAHRRCGGVLHRVRPCDLRPATQGESLRSRLVSACPT